MAKIAFVYPGYESLGIEYLSSSLKKAGHETFLTFDPVLFNEPGFVNVPFLARIFDYSKVIKRELKAFRPDLVCFSVTSDSFAWALNMATNVKEILSVPVIFGGIHPTSVPEIVIQYECVDFVCVGEGEKALVELVDSIEQGCLNYAIENIWFKRKGRIIRNPVRSLEENLDALSPPDKELYYERCHFLMGKGYSILTSRGCPHSCSYCCNSVLRDIYRDKGTYLRRRSVENVLEELEIARDRYKIKYVHFVDEVFTYDKEWLHEFIPHYARRINLPFACYISPQFADEEIADLLKEGGCYKVQMGIQSLDEQKRRELLNRHYSNKQIASAIEQFRKKMIYITCDNIFGLPSQNEEEILRMAEFYSIAKPNFIEVFWLRYYPRTEILETAQRMGIIDKRKKESIERSLDVIGIARGGDTYKQEFARFQLLLNLFHFIPKLLRSLILRKKIYNLLPVLSPIFITIFFRLFNRAKFDLYTSLTFGRYAHFMGKKLLLNFNQNK